MKDYLVDVPVTVLLWIRPDAQRKQFEIIREARPSTLLIMSDGGRTEEEKRLIDINRKMYEEEVDWNCTIYRYYSDTNLGTYGSIKKMHEFVWSHVDRSIFLEDDILPSVSFFQYCAELLEKYKDDTRIYAICGMNHEGISKEVTSDYFFSRYGSIWGHAFWKRTYDQYYDYAFGEDAYTLGLLEEAASEIIPAHKDQIASVAKNGEYDGHIPGGEFFMNLMIYAQHQLLIIPKRNMITNIGCDPSAAHATDINNLPKGIRRVFDMERYELTFPLIHPKYVFPDTRYEQVRNRIMGFGHPMVTAYRNAESVYRNIKNGNGDYVKDRLTKLIHLKLGTFKED
ncbi:MAG: hypothetical protein IJ225_05495 [Solobacterium sp.]|nr:hypothetical protein [Solobacterium sp.]